VDVPSANGQTPLMWAVVKGHIEVARELIKAGANQRCMDSKGLTPMIIATQYKQHTVIRLLKSHLKTQEAFTDVDNEGCGPVHWAAYNGDVVSLRLFGDWGVNFKVLDNHGMTPLHRAVCKPSLVSVRARFETMQMLLDKDVNPDARDRQGRTALSMAEKNEDAAIILKMLREKGYRSEDFVIAGIPSVKEEESRNGLNIAEVVKDDDEVMDFNLDEDDDEVLEFSIDEEEDVKGARQQRLA